MLRRPAALLGATVVGAATATLIVELADVRVLDTAWRARIVVVLTVVAGLVGGLIALLARRRPALAADAGAVAAAVFVWAACAAALHGTRWGWFGLFSDSAFRTQMATRYATTPALADYGYQGLPAYYPPALGWCEGRLAALTGLAGWEAVKPGEMVAAALVPLAAYLLWRPVVGALPAAGAAGIAMVLTAHPQKPDEWLVLACLAPWWLLTVRDVRAPGVAPWSALRLGFVLGLLVLVHTYWFLPFALATLLSLAFDMVRRRGSRPDPRPARLPWRRAVVVGTTAMVVSAIYWVPAVWQRLRTPSDDLQMRYAVPGGNELPLPDPDGVVGVLGLVGTVWLAWAGWRWLRHHQADELAGGLALALAGAVATLGLGAVAQRFDVGLLSFKARDAVTALLSLAGVLGGAEWLRRAPQLWPSSGQGSTAVRRSVAALPVIVATVATAATGHYLATAWVTGPPALVAQTTRYPDGSSPARARAPWYPVLFVAPTDPSVDEIREAWRTLRPDVPLENAVLVTSQVDLLATTPVYGFVTTKSIYSHPNGEFAARVALLRRVAACGAPACAADLLEHNSFDPVDGLILRRNGSSLVLPFTVDRFPDRTRRDHVLFPDALLAGHRFTRLDLGRIVVIALAP